MPNNEKFKAEKVIEALAVSEGIIAGAARALGCTRDTVKRYIEKYPEVKEAHEAGVELNVSEAHSILLDVMRTGDDKDRLAAAKYLLSTIGGYATKKEIKQDQVIKLVDERSGS